MRIAFWFAVPFLVLSPHALAAGFRDDSGRAGLRWIGSHEAACASGKAQGEYSMPWADGLLFPEDCEGRSGGDVAPYRFIGTDGPNRCAGRVLISFSADGTRRISTSWSFARALPGFRCAQSGTTVKKVMNYSEDRLPAFTP